MSTPARRAMRQLLVRTAEDGAAPVPGPPTRGVPRALRVLVLPCVRVVLCSPVEAGGGGAVPGGREASAGRVSNRGGVDRYGVVFFGRFGAAAGRGGPSTLIRGGALASGGINPDAVC